MRFPASLSAQVFLAEYWQKHALFMPAAIDRLGPSLGPDEVAWLATLADVESRLVFTDHDEEKTAYRVEHGPFAEAELASLPERDWTLLVQDVEKHLPDIRWLLAAADFVPDWRIDDLMISVAAPGGSVGPHKDNYDVFLCQGIGKRSWRLADAAAVQQDPESRELSLLRPFESERVQIAERGDVLYLPPGAPHWGIADELCVTCSIGMRAPNKAELLAGCARLFPQIMNNGNGSSVADTQQFYVDPDLAADESAPGCISAATIRRMRDQKLLPGILSDAEIATVMGCVVTDPKAWLAPECIAEDEAQTWLDGMSAMRELPVHGMARLAFYRTDNSVQVFANGFARDVSEVQCEFFVGICAERKVGKKTIERLRSDSSNQEFLAWLLMHGIFNRDY